MPRIETAIRSEDRVLAAIVPAAVRAGVRADGPFDLRRRASSDERAMDAVLADSFPASDPPSWNAGIARPGAGSPAAPLVRDAALLDSQPFASDAGILDLSRPPRAERTPLGVFTSFAGAMGLAFLAPVAILLVGIPVALSVRGSVEAISWILGLLFG